MTTNVPGLSAKYETIDDYMNDKPFSDVEAELLYTNDKVELVFDKPIFDMAFIITHESLIPKITEVQNHYQSTYSFTTHCIFLPEKSKLKFCIRDLKLHNISYVIILYENSFVNNNSDLYILYPNIEVQWSMTMEAIEGLVKEDYENVSEQTAMMKRNKARNPHPCKENGDELFDMNEKLRYYFCLLGDCRMLSEGELIYIRDYLNLRKSRLRDMLVRDPDIFEKRPLEACRQEKLKYYIYSPNTSVFNAPAQSSSMPIAINRPIPPLAPGSLREPIKFKLGKQPVPLSRSQIEQPTGWNNLIHENKTPCKAKMVNTVFSHTVQQIKKVETKKCLSKQISFNVLKDSKSTAPMKRNDSFIVNYTRSQYFRNMVPFESRLRDNDVISLSSGTETPPLNYELMPITPPSLRQSPIKSEDNCVYDLTTDDEDGRLMKKSDLQQGKRKADHEVSKLATFPEPKIYIMDLSNDEIEVNSSFNTNSPDGLLNLFRLVLNMLPLALPHDNAIINILTCACNEMQVGISLLKNVHIDYDSCKTNGVEETIKSIYQVYEVPEKQVENISDMNFIWKKYFPDHLSNFNLIIVFYKFVKMLILYKFFNNSTDTLKFVSNVIEKTNIIICFDLKRSSQHEKKHLVCFPDTFNKAYIECNKLHQLYPYLTTSKTLLKADKDKKPDSLIKKKLFEFTIGPVLNLFVNSINSIHTQMLTFQKQVIYEAVRTLRFCLKKIHPTLVQSDLNEPIISFENESSNAYYEELMNQLKYLFREIKYYQSVLFTEMHYEFINCLIDFSCLVEGALEKKSELGIPKANIDSLIILDPSQFLDSFSTFEISDDNYNYSASKKILFQYHPDTEIEYLKNSLKDRWIRILQQAFKGASPEPSGSRIIKEINNLIPNLWGLRTFDEAVSEAVKLYYTEWAKIAQEEPSTWYAKFMKYRCSGIIWLNKFNLPITKALEEFQKYENMLKNEFSSS